MKFRTSCCFRSQSRRPMTWQQSLFPHDDEPLGRFLPIMAASKVSARGAPKYNEGSWEARDRQLCADGAFHNSSTQGNDRGSSAKSTAPRLPVSVAKLQSYSNEAHVNRFSCSRSRQESHCAVTCVKSSQSVGRDWGMSGSTDIRGTSRPMPRRLPTSTPRERSASRYNWRFPDPSE